MRTFVLPSSRLFSIPLLATVGLGLLLGAGCGGGGGSGEGDKLPIVDDEAPDRPNDDDDGDGLTNGQEMDGWDIAVDFEGYGTDSLTRLHVTSRFKQADSDGDGLSDLVEYQLRLNPRSKDTDRDGLTDFGEVMFWQSKPANVDTDGDSRGPDGTAAPNSRLFDGNETRMFCTGDDPGDVCLHLGTSPTLADTDGDGLSDCTEFDDPFRSPLVSDLPAVDIDIVGEVDVRLNVEYEESLGQETQYGTTSIDTTTTIDHASSSGATTLGGSFMLEVGVEGEAGFFPPKGSVKTSTKATFGIHSEHTWTNGTETGTDTTTGTETSEYQTDSRTRTEAASSGTISVGLAIRNTGLFAVEVEDFGLTVLMQEPSLTELGADSFKTLATLQPDFQSVILAPGEATEPTRVSSADVNTDLIKQFLARPRGLVFSPNSFKLKGENGVDFDFLTENTVTRTALVEIDLGGDEVLVQRVATNVKRGLGGTHEGITMGDVMEQVLGLAYTTRPELQDGAPTGRQVLSSIEGRDTLDRPGEDDFPQSFWFVDVGFNDPGADLDLPDFDDITLHASDEIRLVYWVDGDNDGLPEALEDFLGTLAEDEEGMDPRDTDQDGLTDREEAVDGWLAGWPGGVDPMDGSAAELLLFGYPKMVVSDPRFEDTDKDGLTDAMERMAGTDPTQIDTDRDGLGDGRDPCPLQRARVLRVDPDSPGDGPGIAVDWSDAYHSLQDAIAAAKTANLDAACDNDVAEIWVAQGAYRPDQGVSQTPEDRNASFSPPVGVSLFGGFGGFPVSGTRPGETKLGQRNPDPFTNGTFLVGDLLGQDDPDLIAIDEPSRADNSFHVIDIIDPGLFFVDGFAVSGGNASGSFPDPTSFGGGIRSVRTGSFTQLRNMLFIANSGNDGGAVEARSIRIQNCTFVDNHAASRGGAVAGFGSSFGVPSIESCRFVDNEALQGGALLLNNTDTPGGGAWVVTDCSFVSNTSEGEGGAINNQSPRIDAPSTRISRSVFRGNEATNNRGGAISNSNGGVNVDNCVFFGNRGTGGGAIAARGPSNTNIVNCTIVANDAPFAPGGVYSLDVGEVKMSNCIVWGNTSGNTGEAKQIGGPGLISAEYCCIESLSSHAGSNNIGQDPELEDQAGGVLLLTDDSPCVDAGNMFVDVDLFQPGFQFLSVLDFNLRFRFIDGNGDGEAIVDMGAFEHVPGF